MNAPAMLNEQKPSEELVSVGFNLVRLRSFDQATTGILDEHHAALRDLQRQFTQLTELRAALGADADTSHDECVTAAIEGRKALAAEASVAMDETSVAAQHDDPLETLRDVGQRLLEADPGLPLPVKLALVSAATRIGSSIDALESERAGADIRVENAQGALRLAQEALAAEKRAHDATRAEARRYAHTIAQLEAAIGAESPLENNSAPALTAITSLRSDLAARDATIGELRVAISKGADSFSDLREKLASAELLLGQADETVAYLREKLRQAQQEIECADKFHAVAIRERDTARAESASLTEQVKELENRWSGEVDSANKWHRLANETTQRLAESHTERDRLTERLAEVERERDEARNETEAAEQEHANCGIDFEVMRRGTATAQARIDKAAKVLSWLDSQEAGTVPAWIGTRIEQALAALTSTQPESREPERPTWGRRIENALGVASDVTLSVAELCDRITTLRTQLAARSSEGTLREAIAGLANDYAGRECALDWLEVHKSLRRILAAHPAENPTPAAGEALFDKGLSADASITIDGITGTAAEWAKVHRERDRLMVELAEARESHPFIRKSKFDDLQARSDKADGMLRELIENYSAPGSWEVAQRAHMIRVALTTPSDAPEQEIPGVEWVDNGDGDFYARIRDRWGDPLDLLACGLLDITAEDNGSHGTVAVTREQVRDTLVPLLTRFAATGKLAPEQAEKGGAK